MLFCFQPFRFLKVPGPEQNWPVPCSVLVICRVCLKSPGPERMHEYMCYESLHCTAGWMDVHEWGQPNACNASRSSIICGCDLQWLAGRVCGPKHSEARQRNLSAGRNGPAASHASKNRLARYLHSTGHLCRLTTCIQYMVELSLAYM